MDPRLARSLDELFAAERLSRRRLMGRAGGTGLALSSLSALLAACGGGEDGECDCVEEINGNFEFFDKVRSKLLAKQPIGRDMVVLTDFLATHWVRLGYCEPLDNPKLAENPLIFPSEEIRAKLQPFPVLSPADERTVLQAMDKVTGG